MNTKWVFMLISFGAIGLTCSREDAIPTAPASTIGDVISSGGEFEDFSNSDEIVADSVLEQSVGDEVYYCVKRTHRVTQGFQDYPVMDPNSEIVYPGNLLQGATLSDATPAPIPVRRGPGTIVMTIMSGIADGAVVQYDIDEVTLGNVYTAANTIVGGTQYNDLAARISLSYREIKSAEELKLAIGGSFKNATVDIAAQLNYQSSIAYNRILVKLCQSYFTLVYQLPTSYGDVFHSSVTPDMLAQYIGPGNPAAFISSVTYGRIFYLLIQSTSSTTELKMTVEAFVNAAAGQGSGSVQVENLQSLEETVIEGIAVGGDAATACAALRGNLSGLRTFIDEGGKVTTGFPISYVVRSLARPDRIVKVKVNTEYDEISCVPAGMSLDRPIFWYAADNTNLNIIQDGSRAYISMWNDALTPSPMHATSLGGHYGGEYLSAAISSREGSSFKPAIKCQFMPALVDGIFRYSGESKFIDTDYTIFALVKLDNLHIDYPCYFLFGTSTEPLKNLSIGFWNDRTLILSHKGYSLKGALPSSYTADDFNVYIFRFSKKEGMSIFVNFERQPIASDPSQILALIAYSDPCIGSNTGVPLQVVEVRAFGVAATEAQRIAIVKDFERKYNF